ncbi:ribonuclease H-like domain-containing protein, partial [Tanacetum coccineum]
VVKPTTIRTVLSLALTRNWPVHQLDVKNAFLNGNLSKTVYMYQPPGFVDSLFPHHVCRLQRSLYGLKQAPRAWFQRFAGYALRVGFTSSRCDSSLLFISMEPHLAALKWVLRYVCGTLDFRLQLYASPTSSLVAYSDADWAGCLTTRQSTSGYYVFFGDNLLSWSLKRQHTLSRSSVEAEYHGVANVVAETAWLRNLLYELHTPLLYVTFVYCENVSTIYMTANPVQHQRTKHIVIDIHFVRDMVARGHVRILHVPSRY